MFKLLTWSHLVVPGKIKASNLIIFLPWERILPAELYIHVSPFHFHYFLTCPLLTTYLCFGPTVNKVRSEFRNIFFEMGFTEMPTNR